MTVLIQLTCVSELVSITPGTCDLSKDWDHGGPWDLQEHHRHVLEPSRLRAWKSSHGEAAVTCCAQMFHMSKCFICPNWALLCICRWFMCLRFKAGWLKRISSRNGASDRLLMNSMVARSFQAAIIVFPNLSGQVASSRYHEEEIMDEYQWGTVRQYGKSFAAWKWIWFYTEHTLAETNVKVDDIWILIQPLLFAGIGFLHYQKDFRLTLNWKIFFSLISLGCTCRMAWTRSCGFLANFCHSCPQRQLFSALAIDFGQRWCGRWRNMVIMTGFIPTSSAPIHPLGGHLSFHSTQMTG